MHVCMDDIRLLVMALPVITDLVNLTRLYWKVYSKHPPIRARLKKFSRLLL